MLALGIDIGTSGVRTAVVGTQEGLVSTARADHPPRKDDRVDAEDWWRAVSVCLGRQVAGLREAGRDPAEVTSIAVDGTSGSMVLTDAGLSPVSPALMYNSKGFDAEATRIARQVHEDHITKGPNSALARAMRLVAMAEATPAHLLHQADFVAARLMGRGGFSDFNNALKTGFDPGGGGWPDWIDAVIDPAILPDVRAPGECLGTISAGIAADFGLAPGTRVHAGTTDSIAAFLAAAPMEDGAAVTSLGSTLAVKLMSPTRIDDPAIGLYSHRLGQSWLVGGASNTGGAVLRAFFDTEALVRLSAMIDPASPTGLDYYPLLEPGERFPINDPDLQPRLEPRPKSDVDFLQALFEGMAAIEARCYRAMEARGARFPTAIFTAGGGARNEQWVAIREAALGVRPSPARETEAAVGTARLASSL